MIGVAIPAHNEEALLPACLRSIERAARHADLVGEQVVMVVAVDRCTDRTGVIARRLGARTTLLRVGNVGLARAAAADVLVRQGARWIASTDADSRVPENWLAAQLELDCDVFCGIVQVEDWGDYHPGMPAAFTAGEAVRVGHPHIHGANMGFRASSYLATRGYESLTVSEDVALVNAFIATGARIARMPAPVVTTSTRRQARAVGGFSDYLRDMEARLRLEDAGWGDPFVAGASPSRCQA